MIREMKVMKRKTKEIRRVRMRRLKLTIQQIMSLVVALNLVTLTRKQGEEM